MNFTLKVHDSRATMADDLARLIADGVRRRVAARGGARIAVPGGSTPGPMLSALGAQAAGWDEVVVTLTDERWVPASSERSNQRLLSRTLFAGAAAAAMFVPLHTGDGEPLMGIDAICRGLEQTALPLDIAVLGMGADMHTASLFPGAVGLERALAPDAPPAVVIKAAGAEEPRITLSAPVLARAERHILIHGAEKRAALDRAQQIGDPAKAPVLAVLDGATVHYAD